MWVLLTKCEDRVNIQNELFWLVFGDCWGIDKISLTARVRGL